MNSFVGLIFALVVAGVYASNITNMTTPWPTPNSTLLPVLPSTKKPMEHDFDRQWEEWKISFAKKYEDQTEDNKRKAIWRANLKKIEEHNNKPGSSFTLAINELGDLTLDEYRLLLLGTRYNSSDTQALNVSQAYVPPNDVTLPTAVNWVIKGYVTHVKNQGQCGSCWAFSATGSLEGQHFKKTRKLVSLSEQNLVDCSTSFGNKGCKGGLPDNAFRYIKANGGVDTEASYPYTARDGTCKFNKANVGATCTGYRNIQSGSESHLQFATALVGPISVAIDASHSSFQHYQRGVYDEPNCSSTPLDHAVLVVGYGTLDGKDYWLVKNSWGTSWGMQGYIMMSRNKNNQCGIATLASFPLAGGTPPNLGASCPTSGVSTRRTMESGVIAIISIILSILLF